MRDSVGVNVLVLSRSDEHVSIINSVLRDGGVAAHCSRLDQPNDLEKSVARLRPALVMLFADELPQFKIETVGALIAKSADKPPLLLVRNSVDEQTIAADMESGARDVVSMTHRNRLLAVVERELQAQRIRHTLDGVMSSANVYKRELRDLMDGASEAIADIQEGILVAANPAWLALLGYESFEDIEGLPVMDLYRESDQPGLKGALVACLKEKWNNEILNVVARTVDGGETPMAMRLEKTTLDGDPAVRLLVSIDPVTEQTPAELVEQAVYTDPTTGFFHRHYLLERTEARLQEPLGGGIRALVYIRPDHFARVHDDIGLLATEDLLTRLAELLKEFMQPADIYGRFGGTMFVALLERGTMGDAEAWADSIRKAVAAKVFDVDNRSTSLTCTIGLIELDPECKTIAEALAAAEHACRRGRDVGGNRVEAVADTSITASTRAQDALWIPRLRVALMKNRLRLVHQPLTGLNQEIENCFDTRVRLLDETDQLVLPREFMPAAERAGLVKNIDRWVIGASFSFCAAKKPTMVFVRLAKDSVVDPSLLDWLTARCKKIKIRPQQVCFQVDEEVAARQLKETMLLANKLRKIGFKFSIDHLGTGRDSKQLLKHVPMDYAKIDGSLMQGLHLDKDTQKSVGELAKIAKHLGIATIAERVEDANAMAVLWQLGIDHIQGNYNQMHGVVLEDTTSIKPMELSLAEG